jgi:nucleoside-diphosphate-sugar epimerase
MKILVTGASGAIGYVVTVGLRERGHDVRGFDRAEARTPGEHVVGDLTDANAVNAAVAGVDTVVHLGATPDVADFVTDLVPNNIVGTYNVFEAARLAGVKRVVYASSARVAFGVHHGDRHKAGGPTEGALVDASAYGPTEGYSVTKATGELLGKMFAQRHKMSVICARIGWFMRNPGEIERAVRWNGSDIYLSHDDTVRFFTAAVEAENVGYDVFFVVSRIEKTWVDTRDGLRIGYEPKDVWPDGTRFRDDLVFASPPWRRGH